MINSIEAEPVEHLSAYQYPDHLLFKLLKAFLGQSPQQLVTGVHIGDPTAKHTSVVDCKLPLAGKVVHTVARTALEKEYGYCSHQHLLGLVIREFPVIRKGGKHLKEFWEVPS